MAISDPGTDLPADMEFGHGWTQEEVKAFVLDCYDRDTILQTLLGYASQWFEQRAIFIVGKTSVQPHVAEDWPGISDVPREDRMTMRGPIDSSSPALKQPRAKGHPKRIGLKNFFDSIDVDPPEEMTTIAIPIGGRAAILLAGVLADPEADPTSLVMLAGEIGEQLEKVIKHTKSGTLPPGEKRIPPLPKRVRRAIDAARDAPEDEMADAVLSALEHSEAYDSDLDGRNATGMDSGGFPGVSVPSSVASESGSSEADDTDFSKSEGTTPGRKVGDDNRQTIRVNVDESEADVDDGGIKTPGAEISEAQQRQTLRASDFEKLVNEEDDEEAADDKPPAVRAGGGSTQRLGLEGDSSSTMSGPRLSMESESPPSDEDEETTDKETMFGAPAAESDAVEEAQQGNAGSTMFGVPLHKSDDSESAASDSESAASDSESAASEGEVSESKVSEADDSASEASEADAVEAESEDEPSESDVEVPEAPEPKSYVSEPEQDSPPSLAELAGEDIEEDSASSSVSVIPPKEASEAKSTASKTLMGGIEAEAGLLKKSERDEEAGEGDDSSASEGTSERTPRAAVVTPVGARESDVETSTPEEDEKKPAPKAFILKKTKIGKSDKDSPKEAGEAADKKAASEASEGSAEESSGSSASATVMGWVPGSDDDEKDEKNAEVDDAWLDYFAAEDSHASDVPSEGADEPNDAKASPTPEAPTSEELDEHSDPKTIPPEALEKMLDSGPHIVELQESFMIMDSRDREKAFEAAEEIARSGHQAVPILETMFPGRLFIDRYQYPAEKMPDVDEHGPVLDAIVRIGDPAIPMVRKFLEDPSLDKRFYATLLFTKLPTHELLPEMVDRLFDRDKQIREVARGLISNYSGHPDFEEKVLQLLREALSHDEELHVEIAATMLAKFRDRQAVVPLIEALGTHAEKANKAVYDALRAITLKSWSSPYEWRQWYEESAQESREGWLVDALDDSSETIRQLAYEETQRLPGLDLNYHPDQPTKLRERAQNELREWFDER